jgi:hypothetical protein
MRGEPPNKNAAVLLRFYVRGNPAYSAPLNRRGTRAYAHPQFSILNSQFSILNSQLMLDRSIDFTIAETIEKVICGKFLSSFAGLQILMCL